MDGAPAMGNDDAPFGGRGDIQGAVIVPGDRDQPEVRQPLDQRTRHGRALPYVAEHVKGLQNAGGLVGHREWPVEDGDLATGWKLRPVGGFLRKMEVVVEDGDLHGASRK